MLFLIQHMTDQSSGAETSISDEYLARLEAEQEAQGLVGDAAKDAVIRELASAR